MAIKSLYIQSNAESVEIAFCEDKRLVEFTRDSAQRGLQVGDLCLGRVKKLSTSLNAAFVDVGSEKDGFLHYLDMGPSFNSYRRFVQERLKGKRNHSTLKNFPIQPPIDKGGKIGELLEKGELLMVQVVKEPINSKGPRLTAEISIPGRFMVLMPFNDGVTVSKKIKELEERKRIKSAVLAVKPKNYGFILRTAAENASIEEIQKEVQTLLDKWEQAFANIHASMVTSCILKEEDRTVGLIRDLLNDSFEEIVVDQDSLYQEVKKYVQDISPELLKIVKIHKSKSKTLFEQFEIDRQIRSSFGRSVSFVGGAYLVIDHTEAMHVIDVNSGNRTRREEDQETNVLNINIDACEEVARQLRLRDMGGLVMIDFIDMKKATHKKMVFDKMIELMKLDRATTTITPIGRFGVMELTRERVRPETNVSVTEACPSCNGTGTIQSSLKLIDELEAHIKQIFFEQNEKVIHLWINPFIFAYLTQGFPSIRMKWFFRYGKWIKLHSDNTFSVNQYQILNATGENMILN